MARRKKGEDAENNGVAVADPPPNGVHTEPPPAFEQSTAPPSDPPAERKNRPAASFAAMTDRQTRVEIAVWAREVKVGEGETYTQYSLTVTRSWRDKEGRWSTNAFYRTHDVPVLLCLVQQAYSWCIAQRTTVRTETDEPLPF
jgi:hypothetical protein